MVSLGLLCQCNIILITLFTIFTISSSQNVNISIPLNKTITLSDKELYGDFFLINCSSTLRVNLENVNKNVSFIIFQAHSHLYNITLYNNTLVHGSSISGTNVGLYSPVKNVMDTFFILNDNDVDLNLYISIHGYSNLDPIPGGANMEFPICISPFMYVKYNEHYINVDAAPPSTLKAAKTRMKYYRMYLPERNFEENAYFHGIRGMLTLEKIAENGVEIPESISIMPMRRMLSAYPGTGSIYVAVAYHSTNDDVYSVYVPTHTYACSPLVDGDCQLLGDFTSQLLCASILFIGLFTCFFGHRFFKTEMFFVGAFAGILVTYITISLMEDLEKTSTDLGTSVLLSASVMSGVFFGAIWLLFWWFYGIPVLAVFLSTLHLGFLTSAMIYYRIPGGQLVLEQDSTFWSLFIVIMVVTSVALVTTTFLSNILCCAVLGAYATVFAIDYYLGSNLKYIVVNTVRRAVVEKFNHAVVSPPFQWRDAMVTMLWVTLAISGFLFQHYHSRGKPPFPPPPRSISPRMPGTPNFGRRDRYEGIEYGAYVQQRGIPGTLSERTPLLL